MNTIDSQTQFVREAIAELDEWAPAFVNTTAAGHPGLAVHSPRVIKTLATAFGNTPLAWEAATEAVFSGPDRLDSSHEVDEYIEAAVGHTAFRLSLLTV
jgi:hypothetical protein